MTLPQNYLDCPCPTHMYFLSCMSLRIAQTIPTLGLRDLIFQHYNGKKEIHGHHYISSACLQPSDSQEQFSLMSPDSASGHVSSAATLSTQNACC